MNSLQNDASWPVDIYRHLLGTENNYVVDGIIVHVVALSGWHKVT